MSTLLLVDNSNTRTKFVLSDGEQLTDEVRVLPTADITHHELLHTLKGWQFDRVLLCSVVPKAAATLRGSMDCPVWEVSASTCSHLLHHYPVPAGLGADRIANAAAAAALYPLPCLAIDLGTACTFDVIVSKQGYPSFIGGAIAPGLQVLASGLSGCTALLPATDTELPRHCPAIGGDTHSALQAGLLHGYTGMVRGLIQSISQQLGQRPFIVLTGGDSNLWTDCPDWADHIDNQLTLKGILSAYKAFQ